MQRLDAMKEQAGFCAAAHTRTLLCVAVALNALAAAPAGAQPVCVVFAHGVNFGSYSSRATSPTDSAGSIQVSCSGSIGQAASYSILLTTGRGGSFFPRKMHGDRTSLNYNLYTEESMRSVWGDGTAGTLTVADSFILTATTTTRSYQIYGRLFSGQNAKVGRYPDNIIVSVMF